LCIDFSRYYHKTYAQPASIIDTKREAYIMTYNLWQIRTAKGYSLRELEELSGVSKTTINNIENGKANPTIETLRLLAAALEVELFDLLEL
jgi:putative transcriptional regulator